jgi:hypothetical protein
MPVVQTILSAGVIGAFTFVIGAISSLQAQVGTYQTNQALELQRLDSLEHRATSNEKTVDTNRMTIQGLVYQVNTLNDSLKTLVISGRPK